MKFPIKKTLLIGIIGVVMMFSALGWFALGVFTYGSTYNEYYSSTASNTSLPDEWYQESKDVLLDYWSSLPTIMTLLCIGVALMWISVIAEGYEL